MTAADLIAFETEIADAFNAAQIRAPIHLDGGNEEWMLKVFEHVKPEDWLCGSWRMHYACLLKGVPPEELKAAIMAGQSISLCFPAHRIISSAIVAGTLPIAVGLGMAIKRRGGTETVWALCGDMTAETGTFHECHKYVANWGLPVRFIVADNRKSVCTDTRLVWNSNGTANLRLNDLVYEYELPWPHSGAGRRVEF